jgi:hypothetical protein
MKIRNIATSSCNNIIIRRRKSSSSSSSSSSSIAILCLLVTAGVLKWFHHNVSLSGIMMLQCRFSMPLFSSPSDAKTE